MEATLLEDPPQGGSRMPPAVTGPSAIRYYDYCEILFLVIVLLLCLLYQQINVPMVALSGP